MKIPSHKRPFKSKQAYNSFVRRKEQKINEAWENPPEVLADKMNEETEKDTQRIEELEEMIGKLQYRLEKNFLTEKEFIRLKKEYNKELKNLKFKLREFRGQKTLV